MQQPGVNFEALGVSAPNRPTATVTSDRLTKPSLNISLETTPAIPTLHQLFLTPPPLFFHAEIPPFRPPTPPPFPEAHWTDSRDTDYDSDNWPVTSRLGSASESQDATAGSQHPWSAVQRCSSAHSYRSAWHEWKTLRENGGNGWKDGKEKSWFFDCFSPRVAWVIHTSVNGIHAILPLQGPRCDCFSRG